MWCLPSPNQGPRSPLATYRHVKRHLTSQTTAIRRIPVKAPTIHTTRRSVVHGISPRAGSRGGREREWVQGEGGGKRGGRGRAREEGGSKGATEVVAGEWKRKGKGKTERGSERWMNTRRDQRREEVKHGDGSRVVMLTPPPPPCVQRMPCPTNTSVRAVKT